MNFSHQIGTALSRSPAGHLARHLLSRTALSAMVAAGSVVIPTGASYAQAQPGSQAAQAPVEEIVVTGSRVIRNGYEAPTPVSVVSTEALEAAARPDIADFVNTMPAVNGSFTPTSGEGNMSGGNGGINAISLHGLGPARTLVLLDGHRSVDSSAIGYVDVSAFPQALVSRVDVVTGGASAAYGSDAVGGVVNFILDKNFTGLKGEVSGGVSTYGDDRSYKIDVTGGTGFADDKGHAIFSAETEQNAGIPNYATARNWAAYGWTGIMNPAYTATSGQPQFLFLPHTGADQLVPGGIITAGPLKGITFGPNGVPQMFNYGSITSGIVTSGGEWNTEQPYNNATVDSPITRKNLFARASYDIADQAQIYFEASWAEDREVNGEGDQQYPGNLTILSGNPYIPASTQAQMTALKLTSFAFGTLLTSDSPSESNFTDSNGVLGIQGIQQRSTNRYLVGADGKFDAFGSDWSWDTYYQRGETRTSERTANNVNTAHFLLALDAVANPTTGAIVCRSTLTNPTNGCVPFDPFGLMFNVNSRAAYNYTFGISQRDERITEDVASFSVNGRPFDDWAGPVSFATGAEWRDERIFGITDAVSQSFGWLNSSYQPTIGSYNVKEAFIETLVPLAKSVPWAQTMDVDLAARVTDYSTSGTVETWKVGPTWQPIDDIRFRGSISRDVRAPNLGELFAGGSNSASAGAGLLDPFNGNLPSAGSLNITGVGNPNLLPESALNKGIGAVIQPRIFPGFSASVDYWDTNLTNAIGTLAAQDVLNQCYAGNSQVCSAITRPPVSSVLTVRSTNFNIATSIYSGIDFEAGYKLQLSDVASSMNGTLDFRILATLNLRSYTNNGVTPAVDQVGSSTIRKWKYNGTITWSDDPITLVVQPRGFSSGVANKAWIQCTTACPASTANNPTINDMYQRPDFDIDTTLTYKVDEHVSAYLSVQNWMNRTPPPIPTGVTGNDTTLWEMPEVARGVYENTGRLFRVGLRFKM